MMKRIAIATAACVLLASAASAEDLDWKYGLTTYIGLTNTGVSVETPAGDLDFAFSAIFEARKGKWSLLADGLYVSLSPTNSTPGPLTESVTVQTQSTIISGYAAYRVFEAPSFAVDLAGGFRWAKVDSDVSTSGGTIGKTKFNSSDDWVDPVIGVRLSTQMSEKVSAILFADYGGFSGDSTTWQTLVSVDYALNDRWVLVGGYRYMEFDREIDGRDFSMDQSGVLFGATYKF
jgi:opacity protein-like surface antigen